MGRTEQDPSSPSGPPRTPDDPETDGYQPPQVAWEEEFSSVAASDPLQCPGGGEC